MKKLILFAAAVLLLFSCTPGEIVTPGDNKPATVQVTGITLDKTSLTIKEGESVTLTPTVKPDNATNKLIGNAEPAAPVIPFVPYLTKRVTRVCLKARSQTPEVQPQRTARAFGPAVLLTADWVSVKSSRSGRSPL